MRKITEIVIRAPRMVGCPRQIVGFTLIRSNVMIKCAFFLFKTIHMMNVSLPSSRGTSKRLARCDVACAVRTKGQREPTPGPL